MQDRFRFRAWYMDYDKTTEMIYDVQGTYDTGCCEDYPGSSHHDRFQDVLMDSNAIVMQCTGLKDKYGKLIYEGDILKTEEGLVKVEYYHAEFILVLIDNPDFSFVDWDTTRQNVIGNIYENPEIGGRECN